MLGRPPLRAVLALAASVALAIAEDATCADLGCSTKKHDEHKCQCNWHCTLHDLSLIHI